jgi:prepilin-type N-terminal cleavage/methylation domain-containing protein
MIATHKSSPLIKRGMTLIELLVVVAIIGILASLLLPAIQAAREASRRITCQNQLRQLSLATVNYSTSNTEYLPALWRTDRLQPWDNFGWRVALFPYLEQQSLHDQLQMNASPLSDSNRGVLATVMEGLQCPSTPDSPRMIASLANRPLDSAVAASDYVAVYDVKTLTRLYPLRGVWNGGPDLAGTLPPPPDMLTSDYISPSLRILPGNLRWVTDGLSQTVMLTEQAAKPFSYGARHQRKLGELQEGPWGTAESSSFRGERINDNNANDPYSFHDGVVVALCDGSVQFWSPNMHREIVMALMSRDGYEVIDAADWR